MNKLRINILDPETTHFNRGPGGALQLTIDGKIFFPRVWVYRVYPLSEKNELISVRDASKEDLPEIGIISDLKQFPADVQTLIGLELEKRYFVPLIKEIITIKEARDHLKWDVLTDKGKRQFTVRNPYENIRSLEDSRLIITDINNCRYEIHNYRSLDNKVKDILAKYIYI